MLVLHLSYCSGEFYLWAEKTPEQPIRPQRGKKLIKPCPFDAGINGLSEAVSAFHGEIPVTKKNTKTVLAWLPSRGTRPIASSPFIAEVTDSRGKIKVRPWTVTGRKLNFSEMATLLTQCAERSMPARGIIAASDLRWYVEAFRLAVDFVVRQSYMPGISEGVAAFYGRWQPVLDDVSREQFMNLVAQMPGSCRCLSIAHDSSPPETNSEDVAAGFITRAVDGLVRESFNPGQAPEKKRKPVFDSIHDAWLHSLRSPDDMIHWKSLGDLIDFTRQVRRWQRPIRFSAHAAYRLVFRLNEPETITPDDPSVPALPAGDWRVEYLIQPKDDLSLLLPVADIWEPHGKSEKWLKKHGGNPKEYLLAALGQASELCPHVAASLSHKHPTGFALDTASAHRFLTKEAAMLEAAGFGVLLPSWWTRKGARQALSARMQVKSPKMQASAGLSVETVCQFEYELALGGESLSLKELQNLAALKTPLVKLRGTWVELDAGQLRAAAYFWQKHPSGSASVGEIIRTALGGGEVEGIPVEDIRAKGWVQDLLKQLKGEKKFRQPALPEEFAGSLRPYQQRGYGWLAFLRRWGLGACLADDMGLGKTIQALALIQRERELGESRPVLLVCPTSVVNNWRREAGRFTPNLPVLIHHGADRRQQDAFITEAGKYAMVISTYGLIQRDAKFLKEVPWSGIILDEAQNIKNPETKQSRAARSIPSDYRIVLTGTPVENHVGDLWSIMDFLNPGLLGSQTGFRERFFKPIQFRRKPDAAERLKRLTGPFIMRRLKTDKSVIADIPEKLEMKTYCSLTKEQASLYAAVLREIEESLDEATGIQRKGLILSTLTRLKQVCNHPAHFLDDNSAVNGRSGKMTRLVEMLEEVIQSGDRALVFTQFAEMGTIMQRHLQETFGQEILFLHGGIPRKRRDQMVERFQQDGHGPPVFILSLKAGGTGLNLMRANHVFHFDRWWNPSVENQATDRAFRIGQVRNVQVHKFICAGTLEERIDELIERKISVAESVVGTGETWLTEMSTEELKEVIALSKEAVADQP
ncbi:MAG: DEAD/DEAH box helicase [Dehalococcoidia bacterium]